ncbi:MAG: peptidoglycan DD-metalloendopeptidase family protein [Lachnospiraceae bacterium]|nr:peptidoglycan DD-metalloendopeptidase family protein [Lachnospiraceae bacterium]
MERSTLKKIIRTIVVVWLAGLLAMTPDVISHADDIDDLKERIDEKEKQKKNLENEKKQLQQGKRNVQAVIDSLEGQKEEMSAVVVELDSAVAEVEESIEVLNLQIADKEAEVETTRRELLDAESVALAQYEAMKDRIRFMYERGDTLYIELMMGAESFGDMLNKVEYIQQLSDYDRKKLREYQLVVDNVRATKEVLEEEEGVLEATREAAREEEDNLNTLIAEKKAQIEEFEASIADQEDELAAWEAELDAQNAIIAQVEAQIAADKNALAEAQRLHYNGGKFAWPAPQYTRISSPFGWRVHPITGVNKLHAGVDLAAPGGSPILAAYDGKVVSTGYNASMGNFVMIDHGDNLITVYMHASAVYVSNGQSVSRAQKIAAVGTTGNSTGNHLHFGVRLNGAYVDPMPYITN